MSAVRRLLVTVTVTMAGLAMVAPAAAIHGDDPTAVPTDPNPALPGQCGIDVALVLDTSNSITVPVVGGDPVNGAKMKDAAKLFVDALTGTPSTVGVYSFHTTAVTEIGLTDVRTTAGGDAVKAAIDGTNFDHAFGGFPNGTTNWQAAFEIVAGQGADLVVFATDGNPTTHNDELGSLPTDFLIGVQQLDDLHRGILASNAVKGQGSRIVGVAIGTTIDIVNIQRVTGAAAGDDYLQADFDTFGARLQQIASELCAGSVSATKLVDEGDGNFVATPGWQFNLDAGGAAVVANPADGITDAGGGVSFKVSLVNDTQVTLTEEPQTGYAFVGATCTDQLGATFATTDVANGVTLTLGLDDIVTCEFRNRVAPATIDLVKTVQPTIAQVGQVATYTFTVTNTGSVTLTDLALVDDKLGAITLAVTSLAPGESTTGTATRTVTAADLPGPIPNTATVTGRDPEGREVTDSDDATLELAALGLTKVASLEVAQVGDTITYTFTVTNRGGVTLSNVTVSDDKLGAITLDKTTLAPGESATGTATKTVAAADLPGPLRNVATATSKDPRGNDVAAPPADEQVGLAALDVVKSVDTTAATVGDTITYTYVLTNIGSVTLTNLTLVDDRVGPVTLSVTTLLPGEKTTATAPYVVTAADAASPPLVNIAVGTGKDPSGRDVTDRDQAQVPALVLQAATTTLVAVTTLPRTGGQLETGHTVSTGLAAMMLGGLLILTAATTRREPTTRVASGDGSREWARRMLYRR